MKVEIHHIISETSKEIYCFEDNGKNVWEYSGIYFSNRNNGFCIWGDEWNSDPSFLAAKNKALQELAYAWGYDNIQEAWDNEREGWTLDEECAKIQRKWNPCCVKTNSGELHYWGISWGSSKEYRLKYPPKISEAEIKAEILRQISDISVVF